MRLRWLLPSLVMVSFSQICACKAARAFLLGDPDAIPKVSVLPQEENSSPLPMPVPPEKTARPPMRLPNGTMASEVYAEAYECKTNGQIWRAHLILEPKAFSPEGTKDELQLLKEICEEQKDADCVEKCAVLLTGKPYETPFEKAARLFPKDPKAARTVLLERQKLHVLTLAESKLLIQVCTALRDAKCLAEQGARGGQGSASSTASDELGAEEGSSDASIAHARSLAASDPKAARALLEPKVKSKKASKEETELLCAVCTIQHDKKCVQISCAK